MALEKSDDIYEEMETLQDELNSLIVECGLSEEEEQKLKEPITQISVKALLSEESSEEAFLEVMEELRKAIAFLKPEGSRQ